MSNYESKVFKFGNSQAISLSKNAMKSANLKIGDRLEIVTLEQHKLILKKIEEKTFKEIIQTFYKNGGKQND